MRAVAVGATIGRAPESPPAIVSIEGLTKQMRDPLSRRARWVLNGIDLVIRQGEVFGLLGVNGAGKTTTLQCLLGLMRPTAGRITVCGGDPQAAEVRRRVGFLPERPCFYDYLTVSEFLDLVGRLCDMRSAHRRQRIAELLAMLHLEQHAKAALRKLSKGELQRVGIAQALIHEPELVVFDEPLSGLDPLGRRLVRDLVEDLRHRGHSVIFSSHVVPDVESICDRVGVLHQGRILRVGRIDEITRVRLEDVDVTVRDVPEELLVRLIGPADEIESLGAVTRVRVRDPERVDRLVVRALQCGGRLLTLERRRETLEDYLLRTAISAREEG